HPVGVDGHVAGVGEHRVRGGGGQVHELVGAGGEDDVAAGGAVRPDRGVVAVGVGEVDGAAGGDEHAAAGGVAEVVGGDVGEPVDGHVAAGREDDVVAGPDVVVE